MKNKDEELGYSANFLHCGNLLWKPGIGCTSWTLKEKSVGVIDVTDAFIPAHTYVALCASGCVGFLIMNNFRNIWPTTFLP